jgi:hypothetical protein
MLHDENARLHFITTMQELQDIPYYPALNVNTETEWQKMTLKELRVLYLETLQYSFLKTE